MNLPDTMQPYRTEIVPSTAGLQDRELISIDAHSCGPEDPGYIDIASIIPYAIVPSTKVSSRPSFASVFVRTSAAVS
jgi:hypothetical protein